MRKLTARKRKVKHRTVSADRKKNKKEAQQCSTNLHEIKLAHNCLFVTHDEKIKSVRFHKRNQQITFVTEHSVT